jgi:hypothetical protein
VLGEGVAFWDFEATTRREQDEKTVNSRSDSSWRQAKNDSLLDVDEQEVGTIGDGVVRSDLVKGVHEDLPTGGVVLSLGLEEVFRVCELETGRAGFLERRVCAEDDSLLVNGGEGRKEEG